MATVYLAEDLRHHRKVAVKVLRPDLAATLGPERFLREIEIAAQLQHPCRLSLFRVTNYPVSLGSQGAPAEGAPSRGSPTYHLDYFYLAPVAK
jgi:serine/threonine protein kinase